MAGSRGAVNHGQMAGPGGGKVRHMAQQTRQLQFSLQGQGFCDPVGAAFEADVRAFDQFGTVSTPLRTPFTVPEVSGSELAVPVYVNEFWTARQRQANALHEISYRACFKPQLPRFFIERLTEPGDIVYDPFMGRGTTLLEAQLMGRTPYGCDASPLCRCLLEPRLDLPSLEAVSARLEALDLSRRIDASDELLTFYHPETLREIASLRQYLLDRTAAGEMDPVDRWIRMVALNRLTGHSTGFLSVYSLPPNQAVSVQSQRRINQRRKQVPPRRDVRELIMKKSRRLLNQKRREEGGDPDRAPQPFVLLTQKAQSTPEIPDDSVALVVTSPPFLDVVDYATDNWLRCWFIGIDAGEVDMTVPRKLDEWEAVMAHVFFELHRVLRPGGFVAFEVGEVRQGKLKLESAILRCGFRAGLEPGLVMINDQAFTKTANCWGVDNNTKGTNTNRIVVFHKPSS